MNKEKLIEILIQLNHEIYLTYQELVENELNQSKESRNREIYSQIRDFRLLEDDLFARLEKYCQTNKDVDAIYDYIFDLYEVSDDGVFLFSYIEYLKQPIEARRLLEKIKMVGSSIISISSDSNEEDEEEIYFDSLDNIVGEEEILAPLMDLEDVVSLITKIDQHLLLNCESNLNSLTKKQLIQLKYNLIFLNREVEEMLVEDCCLPTPVLVDAKNIARTVNLNDEKVEQAYDNIRKNEILLLFEDLSQKRNYNTFANQLRYIIIDLWMESLSDQVVTTIMESIEDKVQNSYNEDIFEARDNIYQGLYEKYEERLMEASEELSEEELSSIDKGKKKIKILDKIRATFR